MNCWYTVRHCLQRPPSNFQHNIYDPLYLWTTQRAALDNFRRNYFSFLWSRWIRYSIFPNVMRFITLLCIKRHSFQSINWNNLRLCKMFNNGSWCVPFAIKSTHTTDTNHWLPSLNCSWLTVIEWSWHWLNCIEHLQRIINMRFTPDIDVAGCIKLNFVVTNHSPLFPLPSRSVTSMCN